MRNFRKITNSFQIFVHFLLTLVSTNVSNIAAAQTQPATWRADHHMHLASPELCALVGECLPSNNPPAVYAADAITALDRASISKGVVLSCAYLYGLHSLRLTPADITTMTGRENEFTAVQVAQYPARLIGFLSVDPLTDSAIDEIGHWRGSQQLIGLKLHFTASAISVRDANQRRRVANVISAAASQNLPIVVHVGGGKFNATDAELCIRDVLPSAGSSWVQIAHAGGSLPRHNDNNLAVLRTFAEHIVKDDLLTRRVLFDLSYVPAPDETPKAAAAVREQMRRIGMDRFLFGSDFNVLTPVEEIKNLDKLGLTTQELEILRQNCAPWACPK